MIGCYVTGVLPRTERLVEATRAHERGQINERELEETFETATLEVLNGQLSAGLNYVTDGMLKWQDLFRPFTENLEGVKTGSLARWFNNNTFYRKPVIVGDIKRKKNIVEEITYLKFLPKNLNWKAVLPAPYTFTQLSENPLRMDKTELMFAYAKVLREEIARLANLGFKYVQLSDPALVYESIATDVVAKDELNVISEALRTATKGVPIKTCLQTFFGDFTRILPEALDFPVDHLGIDLRETNLEKLKKYSFDKGVALGLIDSRNSLIESRSELVEIAKEIINSIYPSKPKEIFICPNCDLEFLPWERAEEKMRLVGGVATLLGEESYG